MLEELDEQDYASLDAIMTQRVISLLKLMILRHGGAVRVSREEWTSVLEYGLSVSPADDGSSDMVFMSIKIPHKSRH